MQLSLAICLCRLLSKLSEYSSCAEFTLPQAIMDHGMCLSINDIQMLSNSGQRNLLVFAYQDLLPVEVVLCVCRC